MFDLKLVKELARINRERAMLKSSIIKPEIRDKLLAQLDEAERSLGASVAAPAASESPSKGK